MKSKNEFYKAFFQALNKLGYDIKKSASADYYADIYKNGQIVAFYVPNDTIEKNPFITVPDQVMDEINDLAYRTALRCGICTEKPYTEQNQKLPGGAYLLSQYGDVVLACKYHPLFDYVFRTYRLSPESSKPMQVQHYYNKAVAMDDYAVRAGLIDARKLFSEAELTLIHDQLVRFQISPNNDKTVDEFHMVGRAIDRIEEIVPALKEREVTLDFEQEFEQDRALALDNDELELEG